MKNTINLSSNDLQDKIKDQDSFSSYNGASQVPTQMTFGQENQNGGLPNNSNINISNFDQHRSQNDMQSQTSSWDVPFSSFNPHPMQNEGMSDSRNRSQHSGFNGSDNPQGFNEGGPNHPYQDFNPNNNAQPNQSMRTYNFPDQQPFTYLENSNLPNHLIGTPIDDMQQQHSNQLEIAMSEQRSNFLVHQKIEDLKDISKQLRQHGEQNGGSIRQANDKKLDLIQMFDEGIDSINHIKRKNIENDKQQQQKQ